ncbi:flagellar biosynthesis protein FlhF, partial [Pseudomonas aeruginosa]|uniref:flagellar biosynthesis protein FlhF n=1 Tax=Pseudomonas aeruginosa TaxID=287 RepID=UPI003969C31C
MQVKRFFAADMRQAMKLVRDELGPDAAILGNRRVAGGIELTAALDYQAPPAPSKPNPALEVELRKTQARIAEARAELTARPAENQRKDRQLFAEEKPARPSLAESMTAAQAKPQAGGQTLEAMRFELNGLRELIEVQLGSIAWGQLQHQRPQQANLWRRLQRMGLPAELSKPLLERVAAVGDTRQAWRMLLAHLSRAVQTPEQDPLDAGGVLALVGPAGAGKTTTLAKMAARYVLKYGAQSLALVSMDSYRIGAQEQIKTLGRILNVPVTLVDPGQSLIQALAPLARKRMVLIDTAGLPASDPALRMQLEALASPSLNVKNYLVMATTRQRQVLKSA